MKIGKRMLVCLLCLALLAVSWLVALTGESDLEKQDPLIEQADRYLADEVYIKAIPLLEEALEYKTERTAEIEETLKTSYLAMGRSEYFFKYQDLLKEQMARDDCPEAIYSEAADWYLANRDFTEAIEALKTGVQRTGSDDLLRRYEDTRYEYTVSRNIYDDITTVVNGGIQVCRNGKWGLAYASNGNALLPCVYDAVTSFSDGVIVVMKDDVVEALNTMGDRVALMHDKVNAIGNFNENRLSVLTDEGWKIADGQFNIGTPVFEELGTFSEGRAAAKQNGKWGLIDYSGDWAVQPQYDEILMDDAGRSYRRSAFFARTGNSVSMIVGNDQVVDTYEDAKIFSDGYAAVCRNGKWGFADIDGTMKIDFKYDDAKSFSGHLASVKVGDKWGFISLYDNLVVEAQFEDAGMLYNGSIPVKTEAGWTFITLREFS